LYDLNNVQRFSEEALAFMSPQIRLINGTAGMKVLEMENDWMQVNLLPEVGGKIYDLIWKPSGRNFLWHNPRVEPRSYPIESNFDNYWCGGWDDVFPTCDECDFRGEHYPTLGELRSLHWKVELAEPGEGNLVARLSCFGPISPVHVVKTVCLSRDAPVLRVRHEIRNLGPLPLDFLWGTHPALAVTNSMVLRIPAKTGFVSQSSAPKLGTSGQHYAWPLLSTPEGITDMSCVKGSSMGAFCGHYATELEAGWYAVEDPQQGQGFLFAFPRETCPHLWMWMNYGGYRGHHHVIVEPWTSMPIHLAEAVARNTHRHLEAGEAFSVEVSATIYSKPETFQQALDRLSPHLPSCK
jgi:hypothetical protein